MRITLSGPSPFPRARADRARLSAVLQRADEPAARCALSTRLRPPSPDPVRIRLPLLVSLGIHAVAFGIALWLGLASAPRAVSVGALSLTQVEPAAEPEPLVEVDMTELVDLQEPFDVQPVLPEPEAVEPDEVFDPPELERPVPAPLTEVPLRVARLRVPRKRPPAVVPRPTPPPPVARRPVAVPVRRARPPAPRPGPMRVVYRPDVRMYYPPDAQRRGVSGVAVVQIVVDARGIVTSASLIASSGDASLDAAATRLVRAYRFTPGVGRRSARIPVTFRLL